MSRAFVKDHEDDGAGSELPDRLISPHRNLVTPAGLAAIEAELHRLGEEISAARARDDRAALAGLQRDLRYWSQRRTSAEVVPAASDHSKVRFGSRVTLRGAGRGAAVVGIAGRAGHARHCGRRLRRRSGRRSRSDRH